MKYSFGSHQVLTSSKMQRLPVLSNLIFKVFGYTAIGNYARAQVFIRLIRMLPINSFKKILDLGCGLGEYAFMLADSHPKIEITALDVLPERIKAVKSTKNTIGVENLKVHFGPIESLNEQEQFDFIYSVDVFEHIPEEEMPFKEAFKRLKKGGYLLVKMPNITQRTIFPQKVFKEHNDWLKDEHVGQIYDLEKLENRFKKEGFEIVHASYSDGILARFGWEIEYFGRKSSSILHLLSIMPAKLLIKLDNLSKRPAKGNAIQVIGRKP